MKGPQAMLVIMQPGASVDQVAAARAFLSSLCERVDVSVGQSHTVMGLVGDESLIDPGCISAFEGVQRVVPVEEPYRIVALAPRGQQSVVTIRGVPFGRGHAPVIAGPCAVESEDQALTAAKAAKAGGARLLRGEAYKPRKSPYSFQGLGVDGLKIMRAVADEVGLPYGAEVLSVADLETILLYVDYVRIGARNMSNYDLLRAVGQQNKPVILKRNLDATYEELLLATEYIAAQGNGDIILCERGIRTFVTDTRFTPDLAAIPVIQGLSHLPIILDPSHSGGRRDLVVPLARAGLAIGADGLVVDVHPNPKEAKVDGDQALTPAEFQVMMAALRAMAPSVGKQL